MAKILVVDDSHSVRSMLNFLLQNDHDVTEAENGEDALEKAKENQVDLVLSDVNMPKMDGITLISELRKIESYKLTPILVLTTESGRDMKARGREAGATGWVVKPFQPENLVKMIDRVLQ